MMAYELARLVPERIAAIAPVAGAIHREPTKGARRVPLLHFHSTDDPRALFRGGLGPAFPLTDHRVNHPGIDQVIARWAAHAGCSGIWRAGTPTIRAGHSATKRVYEGCPKDAPVIVWALTGAGHVWPGAPQKTARALVGAATGVIDANQEMWRFFQDKSRPKAPPLGK